jgi:hypothetical protein
MDERRALAWDSNSARIQRAVKLLKRTELMLICPRGHEHIIGERQSYLTQTLCPWCKGVLTIHARGYR